MHLHPAPNGPFPCKSLHFFLFSVDASEWSLTKTINLLEKKLIHFSRFSYAYLSERAVKVSVELKEPFLLWRALEEISSEYAFSLSFSGPSYLLSNRDSFLLELENVSSWNSTRVEYEFKESHFTAKITGSSQRAFHTRTEIFKIVEKFHGRSAVFVNARVNGGRVVADGGRVYFESKILSTKALVSRAQTEYVSASLTDENFFTDSMEVGRTAFSYAMIYMKSTIEDALVRNEAYIDDVSYEDSLCKIYFSGFSRKLLNEVILEIKMLFISIVSVKIKNISQHTTAKIFVFEMEDSLVLLGEIKEIKKMLQEVDGSCEVFVSIPLEIEEFICGKKNGKINKVSRESGCTLSIRRSTKVSVVIQGSSQNVEFSLSLIEDEMPTEYSFYLHEKHHKRIIGYGGKSIQRLMKKNGVYIKFDSAVEEGNNVIIRTPKKNKASLYKMYKDVMELAGEVPLLVQGSWRSLSFCDFYSLKWANFRFRIDSVEVFSKEPVTVSYYLLRDEGVRKEFKQYICTIDGVPVVSATSKIANAEKITMSTWKTKHTLSNYFLWKYEEPLFSDRVIWSRKWKKFSDSWDSCPWGNGRFTE